ncbi:MAG: PAS domain S-box protein [Gammaproteobacteria bacterium]|nr:PAS domain S-box protein [Gammaproteobacteria bacterium]
METVAKPYGQLLQDLTKAEARIAELERTQQLTNETLRQLQNNTERYLDLAEVIIVALDEQARITMIGGKGYEVLGYQPGELIGLNWFKVCLPSENYAQVFDVYQNLMSGAVEKEEYFESNIRTKSGEIRNIAWHNSVLTDDNGRNIGTLSSGVDITNRKRTEQALRESEANYKNLIANANVAIFVGNAQQHLYANPRALSLLGYSAEEILHTSIDTIVHPDEKDKVLNRFAQRISGEPVASTYETVFITKQGRSVPVEITATLTRWRGKPAGLIFAQDITARKEAEEKLREASLLNQRIIEESPIGLAIYNHTGQCIAANTAVAQIIGARQEQMLRQNYHEFDDWKECGLYAQVNKAMETNSKRHFESFMQTSFGKQVYLEFHIVPIDASDQKHLLLMATDITEHKKIFNALQTSERKYRQLFENMTSGFALHEIICDDDGKPVNYRYLELNPAFEKQTGVPPSALLGKTILEVLPDTEKYWIETFGRVALTGEPIAYENYSRELGKYYDTWVFSPEKNQFAVIFTDISERKRSEEALREGAQHFTALFEQSSFGVAKLDSQSGRFVKVNQRYCDMLGYSSAEMLAMDFQSVTYAEDLQADLDNMTKLRNGEISTYKTEKRYIHKNGSIVWGNLSALPLWQPGKTPDFHLAIVEDITERKQTEAKLQHQKQEQQQILNNMVDAVISIDEKGKILSFNHSAESMFGYSTAQVIGQNVKMLMPTHYSTHHDTYLSRYATTNEARIIGSGREVSGMRKNGESFPIRLSVAELPRKANGVRHYIGTCHDLTTEKLKEEQLRRSQKMDALGKLTGGIAHDYNNMLGVILGYSKLLQDGLKNDPKLSKYINEIHHASERGTKLSRKLLAFSRDKQPEADVTDVNAILLSEQDLLQKTLTPRITLELDLEDELWPVKMDSGDLEDAILNLSINAMHAMASSGKLTIRTRNKTFNEQELRHTKLPAGDYVVLTVSDTGCGMTEDTLDKIFDPFFTTKKSEGIGLGLSMIYGFVQRCRGDIAVESAVGQGSQFELYFPRHTHAPSAEPKTRPFDNLDFHGSETLLVVDDERAMVDLANEILSSRGYRVLTASDSESALKILSKEPVDLVLSDIIMPGMDGYQLAVKIRKQTPNLKIQLMSGYTENRQQDESVNGLHQRLLVKPFTAQTLLKRVRELLDAPPLVQPMRKPTVMIMDDDENIRTLFAINLKKLGYNTVSASSGEKAVTLYRQSLQSDHPIDVCILDLTIPGGMDGQQTAQQLLAIDAHAKLIVSSGNSFSPVMTDCQAYGFRGAIEKTFDRKKMQQLLTQVLSSN